MDTERVSHCGLWVSLGEVHVHGRPLPRLVTLNAFRGRIASSTVWWEQGQTTTSLCYSTEDAKAWTWGLLSTAQALRLYIATQKDMQLIV